MPYTYVPQDRLRQFRELLGLSGDSGSPLSAWSQVFLPHAEDFALMIEEFMLSQPQLRIILENQPYRKLHANWINWYTLVFTTGVDEALMTRVWRSGQAHVAHNIDHRYISLSYAMARSFCQKLAMTELPLAQQPAAMLALSKTIDFSLLVETDAYVTYATQCELEVIQGISHQVRNPVSVIGGASRRLLRLHPDDEQIRQVAETMLSEAVRLERMAKNVNAYMDITLHAPVFQSAPLEALLESARERIQANAAGELPKMDIDIAPDASILSGEVQELVTMFACLLENAFQFADAADPKVTVASKRNPAKNGFALITITNNGESFNPEELISAFSPFHSSTPTATGFGLPMARVIASKYFGNITLAPMDTRGTKCVITLPLQTAARS